ncbi:MAG TPA: response regulator [Paraburkholderia sp.]|jgi:CheY-like chemotaxis protein|nr:response regulator [Paraburkholderia sp.]
MTGSMPLVVLANKDEPACPALIRIIRSAGYRIEAYPSARELIERGWKRPELVCLVLDVHLPGLSGLQLQQELAAANFVLPIVFASNADDTAAMKIAMQAGRAGVSAYTFLRCRSARRHQPRYRPLSAVARAPDDRQVLGIPRMRQLRIVQAACACVLVFNTGCGSHAGVQNERDAATDGQPRAATTACLQQRLADGTPDMIGAWLQAKQAMFEADRAAGTTLRVAALHQSKVAFEAFRQAQCHWVSATCGSGADTGEDAELACEIDLVRWRTRQIDEVTAAGDVAVAHRF